MAGSYLTPEAQAAVAKLLENEGALPPPLLPVMLLACHPTVPD